VFFVTWDENGGFFDHVLPPTPPAGTAGEYVTVSGVSPAGPVGLGFRVPLLVLSPFSRGGLVSSDTFDHTSLLRFLETRFGAEVPNLSAWRRAAVGDLTSALNLAAPDASMPALPPSPARDPLAVAGCVSSGAILQLVATTPPPYPVPNPQSLPGQEPGHARRPSGLCSGATTSGAHRSVTAAGTAPAGAAGVTTAGHPPGAATTAGATAPDVLALRPSSAVVPLTGTAAAASAVAATLVGAAVALRMRRRQGR
jgi:phospholipase C